ncbi:hypothetical protein CAC42_7002 [Sphaceloma murrayae]|uniref:Uncharacterized protein n=1 Tax=Sphaceloma murrayae TaxID=2082308 RepID=A0A2K1QQR6_9PEZI|nr:hypothetical protein CAC42_7002 [Sphaceloma murrayae]
MEDRVNTFLKSIGTVAPVDADHYVQRLQSAYLRTGSASNISRFFNAPVNQEDCKFDGLDHGQTIEKLGNASLAAVIPTIMDGNGFHTLTDSDRATQIPINLFDKLMPSLYAEHIDLQLKKDSLQSLKEIRKDKEFATAIQKTMIGILFDPFGSRTDHTYAMTCLFAYEYLEHGPDVQLTSEIIHASAVSAFAQWRSKLGTGVAGLMTKKQGAQLVAFLTYAVTGIYSPHQRADTPMHDFAKALQAAVKLLENTEALKNMPWLKELEDDIEKGTIFDHVDFDAFEGVSYRIWKRWNDMIHPGDSSNFWSAGLRAAESHVTSHYDYSGMPLIPPLKLDLLGEDLKSWWDHHCPDNCKNSSSGFYPLDPRYKPAPPQPHPSGGGGSCFIPGTLVQTASGSVEIEKLSEGTRVLTRAAHLQWGHCSDEVVKTAAPADVFGFNDEPAFFTAGHVFHTTTGLRAVNPGIARSENPWIEVAQLRPGHQVYRLNESGSDYQCLTVRSIHHSPCKHDYVYGVHLRDGLRSYHANGYLVHLNYPEITVSSIAKMLNTFPPSERAAMLRSCKELGPVFERFGGGTVLEVLGKEAGTSPILYGAQPRPTFELQARDLNMSYNIVKYKNSLPMGITLSLVSGVLNIDGQHVDQAKFKGAKIWWSRPMPSGCWEHGHCKVSDNGLRGSGWLQYANEDGTNASSPTRILLSPGKSKKITLRNDSVRPLVMATALAAPDGPDLDEDEDPDADDVAVQAGFMFSLDGRVYDPKNPDTAHYDTPIGILQVPIQGPNIGFNILKYDRLDKLFERIKASAQTELKDKKLPEFERLYDVEVFYDKTNQQHITLTLRSPQLIIEHSDEYYAWLKQDASTRPVDPPYADLHFTTIGEMDITIKKLFKTIKLVVAPSGSTMTGVLRAFSSTSSGNLGAFHQVSAVHSELGGTVRVMTAHSLAVNRIAANASTTLPVAHVEPHMMAFALADNEGTNEETITENLTKIIYDSTAINNASQEMLHRIMKWHMTKDERLLFYQEAEPAGLPPQYTNQLDTATSEWLQKTYARACICQVLAIKDGDVRAESRFTAQEKKNARYFFSGKGDGCLSKNILWKDLERSVQRYQLRETYPEVKKIFEAGEGKKYSINLYRYYTKNNDTLRMLNAANAANGTPQLTKITAIMDALDLGKTDVRVTSVVGDDKEKIKIDETAGNMLTYKLMSLNKGSLWASQWRGLYHVDAAAAEAKLEQQWLQDTMADLVKKVLEHDTSVDPEMDKTMSEELAAWGKTQEDYLKWGTQEKAEMFAQDIASRIPTFIQAMSIAFGWVKQGGKWVFGKARAGWNRWRQGAAQVTQAAEAALDPKDLTTGQLIAKRTAKICLVIVGMAALGVCIWQLSDRWSSSDAVDRTQMLISVLSAVKQLADLGTDAVETFFRTGKGVYNERTAAVLRTAVDEALTKNLAGDAAVLRKDASGKLSAVETIENEEWFVIDLNEKVELDASLEVEITLDEALQQVNQLSRMEKVFNVIKTTLVYIGYIIAVAVAIVMTIMLIRDWSKMKTGDRIFQTIQVVLAGLEGLGALLLLGAGAVYGVATLTGAGFAMALGAGIAIATPIFAAVAMVLAVVALIVLVAYFIWQSKQPPPPTQLDLWMESTGKAWAAEHPAPADPVTITVQPTILTNSSSARAITITIKNLEADQKYDSLKVEFTSGSDDSCLFNKELSFERDDSKKNTEGFVNMTVNPVDANVKLSVINVENDVGNKINRTTLSISGPTVKDPKTGVNGNEVTLGKDETITFTVWGPTGSTKALSCFISWTASYSKDVLSDVVEVPKAGI